MRKLFLFIVFLFALFTLIRAYSDAVVDKPPAIKSVPEGVSFFTE